MHDVLWSQSVIWSVYFIGKCGKHLSNSVLPYIIWSYGDNQQLAQKYVRCLQININMNKVSYSIYKLRYVDLEWYWPGIYEYLLI